MRPVTSDPQASRAMDRRGAATRQQAVTDELREMLLSGNLMPGTRLQEVSLSERFGVSRTPLRAALTVLAEEGLLTRRPSRGFEVRQIVVQDVLDAYDVRGTLEGMACRLCAENGIDEAIRLRLAASLEQGDAIATTKLSDEDAFLHWRKANAAFHDTILEAAGNLCLRDVTLRTMRFPFASQWVGRWRDPQRYREPQQMHHAIYDALVRREAVRAEALMREHIYLAKAMVRTALEPLAARACEAPEPAPAAKFCTHRQKSRSG